MMKTSMIIYGSISNDTYKFMCRFHENKKKIFSSFDTIEFERNQNDLFIKSKKPKKCFKSNDKMNDFLKILLVIRAFEYVDSEYVILLKGDEWYSNLHEVESLIEKNQDKIYTIKSCCQSEGFCIGNLLAGESNRVNLLFEECLLEFGKLDYSSFERMAVEKYLKMMHFQNNEDCFEQVDLNLLKYYKITHKNNTWYSNFSA